MTEGANVVRHIWLAALAVVAALLLIFVVLPITSIENQYDAAYARIDQAEQCAAAQAAANEWAKFGPLGRMKFWQDRASLDCFSAAVMPH